MSIFYCELDFKMLKGQVDVPKEFETANVDGHHLDISLQLGFNLDEQLVKADFTIEIKTESKGQTTKEASGYFHLVFIYLVQNLNDAAKPDGKNLIELHHGLANALSSVTYSTSRGILLTRLQGSALQNLVLPIINPNKLLQNNKNRYLNHIRSSRQLEKECKRNLELMWLMRELQPDHNTIANFQKKIPKAIKQVFRATVQLAKHFDLIGGTLIAGDSTKLRAKNSKKNNFNPKKIDLHL